MGGKSVRRVRGTEGQVMDFYESVIEFMYSFPFLKNIFLLCSHNVPRAAFHGLQFCSVFAQGTEIVVETLVKSCSSTELPKHMALRFCLIYLELPPCARKQHGDE